MVVDNNFDSFVQFMDLTDNCNTENKKINKAGDIIRTWVCKFSKNKKGFDYPIKTRTVIKDGKVEVSRLNGEQDEHDRVDNRKYLNFLCNFM